MIGIVTSSRKSALAAGILLACCCGVRAQSGAWSNITSFPLPGYDNAPTAMAAGPDGALWFTEYYANAIGRITITGVISVYAVPAALGDPNAITAGPDGAMWFTELDGNKIGRISTTDRCGDRVHVARNE